MAEATGHWTNARLEIHREYGSKVVGEVTLDQVYGGARGIKSLVWEVGFPQHIQLPGLSCIG